MRLLDVRKKKLADFFTRKIPKYAILSHCWRHGLDEILYEDAEYSEPEVWRSKKKGAAEKVINACTEAEKLGFDYIWIDTCCIDKRSSAELSEAINSMFLWYRHADTCFAFLDDIDGLDNLGSSRWFVRGWTLQELIAPDNVWFYNKAWSRIGDRFSLFKELSDITGIEEIVLRHGHEPELTDWESHGYTLEGLEYRCDCGIIAPDTDMLRAVLDTFSVATIMSWAAGRKTSREEDTAYCLMGLFDINMPLLYGERGKAFIRLQEEIVGRTKDQSILSWMLVEDGTIMDYFGRFDLASSPANFYPLNIQKHWSLQDPKYNDASMPQLSISKEGLEAELLLFPIPLETGRFFFEADEEGYIAVLNCTIGNDPLARPAISINKLPWSNSTYERSAPYTILIVTPSSSPPRDGIVSKGIAELHPAVEDPQFIITYREEIDFSKGEVRRVTLARTPLRRDTHARTRFELPPLRIGKIEDRDAGEYDVDYAMPDFNQERRIAWPCDQDFGLIRLRKQESEQQFFVAWGLHIGRGQSDKNGSGKFYEHVNALDGIWCKVLPVDERLNRIFAAAKEWGRHRRSKRLLEPDRLLNKNLLDADEFKGVGPNDEAVLEFGGVRREVLADLRPGRFLGKAFFELNISVKTLWSPGACSVSKPYFIDPEP